MSDQTVGHTADGVTGRGSSSGAGTDAGRDASGGEPDLAALVGRLDALQRSIASYAYAQNLMNYDAQTVAPAAGAALCGEAMGVMAARGHDLLAGDDTRALLDALDARLDELDDLHRDELRVLRRDHDEQRRVPAQMAADWQRLLAEAYPVWRAAKAADDYASWEPYVDRIVAALRAQAACLDPARPAYDVWLDQFARGCSIELCDRFFAQVRTTVVPLLDAIVRAGQPDAPAFVHARVPLDAQRALSDAIARLIGLDPARLTFGRTEHPFTLALSRDDVRIAHHWHVDDVLAGVYTTVHEGGHSLYEQHVDPRYDFTCLAGGASADVHESQSRLMENMVGRSRPFMDALLPLLRDAAPDPYARVSADELYRAVNRVEPSLVRTEADELTYSLHIMVRYEVEKRLMAGELSAHDAPAAWNELTQRYLGIQVPDDAHGILQDAHWAMGYVGYFPSYALGNAYAAQFMAAMRAQRAAKGIDVDAAVSAGDLSPITSWLAEHLWRRGKSADPQQLIADACGAPFDPSFYTRYLVEKFSGIYGL